MSLQICHTGLCLPDNPKILEELGFNAALCDVEIPTALRWGPSNRRFKLLLDIDLSSHENEGISGSLLEEFASFGGGGFRFLRPRENLALLQPVVTRLRERFPDIILVLDTPGISWRDLHNFERAPYSYCTSSLPWWDLQSGWLSEEYLALRRIAPVVSMADFTDRDSSHDTETLHSRLITGAIAGSAMLVPSRIINDTLKPSIILANELNRCERILQRTGVLQIHTSETHTLLLRADDQSEDALLAIISHQKVPDHAIHRTMLADLGDWAIDEPIPDRDRATENPHRVRLFRLKKQRPIHVHQRYTAEDAAKSPRVIIDDIIPSVNNGRFSAKGLVGDTIPVGATIYSDGHPVISADVLYRSADDDVVERTPLHFIENDQWQAEITLKRTGRHYFSIHAWIDQYQTLVRDIVKKRDIGKDIEVDITEAKKLVEIAQKNSDNSHANSLSGILRQLAENPKENWFSILLSSETIAVMRQTNVRPFSTFSAEYSIDADPKIANFASWYEIFPRSASSVPGRHGTLRDVIEELPRIAEMGFNVLYLSPIHPIGKTNRKGKNNTLHAQSEDVGSVYAIGSSEGGHDAIHPKLGSIEDFRALVTATEKWGMEIALDFAIQCSPDHPWLIQHPGWFDWRPDGSIKYAENPPKVYEDIVNVDFYAPDALPALWSALRDVVVGWIEEGVKIFRVDNPHTKPFPFWEWLIADIRRLYPDIIFLAEAFTRPAVMYQLAKLGFSQSYTYFTWRNSKSEITDYISEITSPPIASFFRPNFFTNTPDINPYYLQHSGRSGFLIRAALAATLSGSWGIFSGFELCEAASIPNREEYLNSDKYEIRARNWSIPGNISAEIGGLNRLRHAEPALQSHLGTTFYNAFNDQVLYFGRHAEGHGHRVMVLVNLDPYQDQTTDFELPLWEWKLPDNSSVDVRDLLSGDRFQWHGKMQRLTIHTSMPYRIFRITPTSKSRP